MTTSQLHRKQRVEEPAIEQLVAAQLELERIAKGADARDRASLHRHSEQPMIAVAEPRAAAELLVVGEAEAAGAWRLALHGEVKGDGVVGAVRIQPHRGKTLGAREATQSFREIVQLHGVRVREAEQAAQLGARAVAAPLHVKA